ncbi:putative ribonuclease H-like domain-containing protein [Tanacetum coccineum]
MGLESLEARIVVHEKNEAVYEEDIAFLKYDVQVKDISIKDLKNQLKEALKEKDDWKRKLEKLEESSKNLTKLINSQISAKHKAGLGYDSQMNESEVVHSVFNSRESNVDDSPGNPQYALQDQGIFDSGCSRHMTGNKSYLTDYQDINDGFVAFTGSPKGGKITGKSKIRTGKLDFEDVYFVKELKCDNGTKFKNNDMNQFCGMKGIKREFSVAKTPQQNGVAERKNRTLIEAARTMLADSLLHTTFWAKAVNTACYVQNRVLVTSLTTRHLMNYYLADEGFLVGYSINSKAFRVFNTKTRKVEENLHINFLESKSNVAGSGIETNVNAGQAGQEKTSDHEYILLPLMLSNSPLSLSSRSTDNKNVDEVPGKGNDDLSERNGQEKKEGASNKEDDQHVQDFRVKLDNLLVQEKEGYANNTNRVYTVNPSVSADGQGFYNADDQERIDSSTQDVNTVGSSINTASENINTSSSNINTASPIPNDLSMQSLEATGIFDDAYDDREEVGAEADLNNLVTTMNVSPIPTTRIHKDHPKDQIIGDINSATQIRRMTKITEEHAMIEAMQEELLQFKLQKVWTLVDLPKGKRAIGTKWVYRNKKYERGIVVRNKARLVAQDETIYKEWEDRMERAATTASSLEA